MRPRKYFPWLVVATSLSNLTINRGTRNSFAVFLVAMSEEFRWSRSEISGVFSIYSLLCGVFAPLMGRLLDRFDAHRVVPISALILAGGLLLCGMVTGLWHFYLTFGLILAVGASGTSIVPHTLMISRWFHTRRGLPMSFGLMGMGLGIFIVVPITQYLIEIIGWRKAFMCQGIGVLLIMVPISYFVFRQEAPTASYKNTVSAANDAIGDLQYQGTSPSSEQDFIWTLGLALRTLFFWAVFSIYIFSSFAMSGVVIHLAAYLVDLGYSKMSSAMVLSLLGLISLPGRILFGFLTDRFSGRTALVTSFTCSTIGVFALLSLYYLHNPIILYFFICIFGVAFGARTTAIGPMVANMFQGPNFGFIFGFLTISQSIGATIGPWLMGYLFDIFKDYRISFMVAMASFFMAAICSCFTGQKSMVHTETVRARRNIEGDQNRDASGK